MKKLISIIMALVLILSLCACTQDPPSPEENRNGKLKIVATIFPQYDFARQIAGDKAQVSMLVTSGFDSHSYEPTTQDMIEINECDIFIYTGGESDSWVDSMLDNIDNPQMTIISLVDIIEPVSADNEKQSTDENDTEGHDHGTVDEHVWTSPLNAIDISEKICEAMCHKDVENADTYKKNFTSYKNDLLSLDENFRSIVKTAKRDTLVFGDRFPLLYFAKEYGLKYYAAFPGCSEDTEASASAIANLINIVNEKQIPVVLKIELSSDATARTICKATGAKLFTFYSCHNISKLDFKNGETYLSLMQKNAVTLKTALN